MNKNGGRDNFWSMTSVQTAENLPHLTVIGWCLSYFSTLGKCWILGQLHDGMQTHSSFTIPLLVFDFLYPRHLQMVRAAGIGSDGLTTQSPNSPIILFSLRSLCSPCKPLSKCEGPYETDLTCEIVSTSDHRWVRPCPVSGILNHLFAVFWRHECNQTDKWWIEERMRNLKARCMWCVLSV